MMMARPATSVESSQQSISKQEHDPGTRRRAQSTIGQVRPSKDSLSGRKLPSLGTHTHEALLGRNVGLLGAPNDMRGVHASRNRSQTVPNTLGPLRHPPGQDHIERLLAMRPERRTLVEKNVLKADAAVVSPRLHAAIDDVSKKFRSSSLHAKLERRPPMTQLKQTNIIPSFSSLQDVSPSISASQRLLQRRGTKHKLESLIQMRTPRGQLEERNIIQRPSPPDRWHYNGYTYIWGSGGHGRLGNGGHSNNPKPTLMSVFSDVAIVQIALGGGQSIALDENGQVYSWGSNSFGQVGIGTYADTLYPQRIGQLTGKAICNVSCGANHTGAISDNGKLYMWGHGLNGELGLGHCANRPVPAEVKLLGHMKIRHLALGGTHSLAVVDDGSLYAWGKGEFGQLGLGSGLELELEPKLVKSFTSKVVQIAAGDKHSAAITECRGVYTWGRGSNGELGCSAQRRNSPCKVKLLENMDIRQVACGSLHTAALTDTGHVYIWGNDGTKGAVGTNRDGVDKPHMERKGSKHIRRRRGSRDEGVKGSDGAHQDEGVELSRAEREARGESEAVADDGHEETDEAARIATTAAAAGSEDGDVDNSEMYKPRPVTRNIGRKCVRQISCGSGFTCCLTAAAKVYTWGSGLHYQLGHGYGSEWTLDAPHEVALLTKKNVRQVVCGYSHAAALTGEN